MIFDRMALMGTGAALVVALGLSTALWLGKASIERDLVTTVAQRDTSEDKADLICGQARSSFRVYHRNTGKPLPRAEWGKDCKVAVGDLQTRVNGEQARITEALLAQKAEQDAKYAADVAAFRRNFSKQSESLKNLEAADAAITNGHYPDRWWIALGDTFGLRQAAETPAPAEPGPAGGGDQGATPR